MQQHWVLGPQPAFGEDPNRQSMGTRTKAQKMPVSPSPEQCFESSHISVGCRTVRQSRVVMPSPPFQNRKKKRNKKAPLQVRFPYLAPFLSSAVKKGQPTLYNFLIGLKFLPDSFCIWRAGEGRASPAELGMIVTEIDSHPTLRWAGHGVLIKQ